MFGRRWLWTLARLVTRQAVAARAPFSRLALAVVVFGREHSARHVLRLRTGKKQRFGSPRLSLFVFNVG